MASCRSLHTVEASGSIPLRPTSKKILKTISCLGGFPDLFFKFFYILPEEAIFNIKKLTESPAHQILFGLKSYE